MRSVHGYVGITGEIEKADLLVTSPYLLSHQGEKISNRKTLMDWLPGMRPAWFPTQGRAEGAGRPERIPGMKRDGHRLAGKVGFVSWRQPQATEKFRTCPAKY
jgi:hypothetical protein